MSESADLNLFNLPYDGHSGAVTASDTSLERALEEDASGTTAARCNLILEHLRTRPFGMTWAELGAALNLHHGQVSGALSMMHKQGLVFALRTKRNRCHPYVHAAYKANHSADKRIDEPVRTRASQERDAYRQLLQAVDALLEQNQWETIRQLRIARALIKDFDTE